MTIETDDMFLFYFQEILEKILVFD